MEFYQQFNTLPLSDRISKCTAIIKKYYPRLPILIDRYQTSDPLIRQHKFIVDPDMYFSEFMIMIRTYLPLLLPSQGLYIFYQHNIIQMNMKISEWYVRYPTLDGFINLVYSVESTFGKE